MIFSGMSILLSLKQEEDHLEQERLKKMVQCIQKDDIEGVLNHIEHGVSVNSMHDGKTLLFYAMNMKKLEIFRLLLNRFHALISPHIFGKPIIWYTVFECDKVDYLEELLFKQTKANQLSLENGNSLLIEAAIHSNLEACRVLLNHGLNVNHQNKKGNTALHEMMLKEYFTDTDIEIVNLLLAYGANPYIQNLLGSDIQSLQQRMEEKIALREERKQNPQNKKTYGNEYVKKNTASRLGTPKPPKLKPKR